MTYTASEQSAYQGKPIEIYTFTRELKVWRYTSAEDAQTVGGQLYTPYPIQRGALEQSADTVRNGLTLNCAASLPVIDAFRTGVPSGITTVQLQRFHYGVNEYVTSFRGRVINVSFKERTADIKCESIYTSLQRPVLRRFYQTNCPHVLYGTECRVSRAAFMVAGNLLGQNGSLLNAAEFAAKPDGWFAGGYIDYIEGDEQQRRFILNHVGSQITVNIPFINIPNNAGFQVYPGCDHTLVTCNSKFANEDNYGGQPFYPGKNPFGGVSVF